MNGKEHKKPYNITKNMLLTLFILAAAWTLCVILRIFGEGDDYTSMIFILAVFLVSRLTYGLFFGVFASIAGVLAVNFFFTYPYLDFNFTLSGYPLAIACMLCVSLSTCAMTARERAAEKIRRENELEKMRANLLRAISHDLRTPLTSIIGAADAIADNIDSLERREQLALLSAIRDDAQWLSRMVENLLTVTRIDSADGVRLKKTPEIAEEIVSEAVGVFRKRFPSFEVNVHIPEQPLFIEMDGLLIEQVLLNLLENSALHSGSVSAIELYVEATEEYASFSVADHGRGLESTAIEKLSGRFGQKASSGGTDKSKGFGIGLSVCESIIRAHGGELFASNEIGGGARFTFRLPLHEKEVSNANSK